MTILSNINVVLVSEGVNKNLWQSSRYQKWRRIKKIKWWLYNSGSLAVNHWLFQIPSLQGDFFFLSALKFDHKHNTNQVSQARIRKTYKNLFKKNKVQKRIPEDYLKSDNQRKRSVRRKAANPECMWENKIEHKATLII